MMKKALVLKDANYTAVLKEENKFFISLGEFILELSSSTDVWSIRYINLVKEGLCPLKDLSGLLHKEIICFSDFEQYAESIKNFIC